MCVESMAMMMMMMMMMMMLADGWRPPGGGVGHREKTVPKLLANCFAEIQHWGRCYWPLANCSTGPLS